MTDYLGSAIELGDVVVYGEDVLHSVWPQLRTGIVEHTDEATGAVYIKPNPSVVELRRQCGSVVVVGHRGKVAPHAHR